MVGEGDEKVCVLTTPQLQRALPSKRAASVQPPLAPSYLPRRIREMVAELQLAEPSTVVRRLDDLSVELCGVVDTAELCRNTHPDRQWVAAADAAYVQIQTLLAVRRRDGG